MQKLRSEGWRHKPRPRLQTVLPKFFIFAVFYFLHCFLLNYRSSTGHGQGGYDSAESYQSRLTFESYFICIQNLPSIFHPMQIFGILKSPSLAHFTIGLHLRCISSLDKRSFSLIFFLSLNVANSTIKALSPSQEPPWQCL